MRKTLFALLLIAAGTAAAETVVYLSSQRAKIHAEASYTGAVVAVIDKGTRLVQIAEQDRWVQVRHGGSTGWLPRYLVSTTPPVEEVSLFERFKQALGFRSSRTRASASLATAGVRGLADGEAITDAPGTNYKALTQLESRTVDPAKLREFIQGIGAR